jgi:hypothetical protein
LKFVKTIRYPIALINPEPLAGLPDRNFDIRRRGTGKHPLTVCFMSRETITAG